MITSERVQALSAVDHEALVMLLALAIARGQHRSGIFDGWPHDPAIRALLDQADLLIRAPLNLRGALEQWNAEMSAL